MGIIKCAFLTLILSSSVLAQENAGTNVAPALKQCYNDTRYVTRDYRLPASINVLIDIIRKIEDGNPSEDAREISFQILQRFRQDGIRKTRKNIDSSQGLPYSPKGWEADKNRLQLTKITPGNAVNFNNDSLTVLETCSLHYMVSSTIETQVRGDESSVCNKISQYTSRIHKRETEIFETDSASVSSCPIESGVVYTKWGAVNAGIVLAGIASGYQPNPIRVSNYTLESSYASTIAGELAETALQDVSSPNIRHVGNGGGWNNTVAPKYYFLDKSDRESLYFTDAEIRGSLDGLYLALNIQDWRSKANNIKISQILDLYYGRGVFNNTSRACNRKALTRDLIMNDKLREQTVGYSILLNPIAGLTYTPDDDKIPQMAQTAVDSARNYIDQNLQDLACSAETDVVERVSTDVLIFIDAGWNHQVLQSIISYILEHIDINKYESSYTIYDGANGDTIVNKSRSILDFYNNFNLTQQQKYPTGFDYVKTVQNAERIFRAKLDNETDLTGQSTIVLMIPNNPPSSSDNDYVRNRRNDFKSTLPDFKILVIGSNSKTSYNDLVSNPTTDIFTLDSNFDDASIKQTGSLIVDRFRKIPRSVVNPTCGSSFSNRDANNFEITQYVDAYGVNYHKISPNYFYQGHNLKIRGQGFGTLSVCISRTDPNPKSNTTDGTTCTDVMTDEQNIDISHYCTDEAVSSCSPIYIAVYGQTSQTRCTEQLCRFPDNIKYTINLESVRCSGGSHIFFSTLLLFVLAIIARL